MLSKRIIKAFSLFSRLAINICTFVGYYDSKLGKFVYQINAQKRFNRIFYLSLCWLAAAVPIIYIRYCSGNKNSLNFSLTFLFVILLLVLTLCLTYFHGMELCRVANGLLSITQTIYQTYMPDFNPNKSKVNYFIEALILIIFINYFLLCLLTCAFVVYDPQSTIHLGKLVPDMYFSIPIRLAVICFHSVIYCVSLYNCCLLACGCALYGFYVTLLLTQELRIGAKHYLTVDKLRKVHNLQLMFRSFQVLNENTMCFVGIYILIFNAVFELSTIFMNFALIKFWEDLPVLTKALLIMCNLTICWIWTAILEMGKLFFVRGGKVPASWKRKDWGCSFDNKLMKKFRLGSKPILISYGNQFVLRKVTILVFYRGIVRGTFRTLMMLGKE